MRESEREREGWQKRTSAAAKERERAPAKEDNK